MKKQKKKYYAKRNWFSESVYKNGEYENEDVDSTFVVESANLEVGIDKKGERYRKLSLKINGSYYNAFLNESRDQFDYKFSQELENMSFDKLEKIGKDIGGDTKKEVLKEFSSKPIDDKKSLLEKYKIELPKE